MTDDAQSFWNKKCKIFNQCVCCTKKKLTIKAFPWATLNAKWAWTSKMTENISAVWMC